jgi:hypothetical protein
LQIIIWLVIPATRNSRADHANNTLALFVLIQYVPRLFLIFPLNQRIIKTTGVVAKTAWAGAAYNLLLYILASHVRSRSPLYMFSNFPSLIVSKTQLLSSFTIGAGIGSCMVSIIHREAILLLAS